MYSGSCGCSHISALLAHNPALEVPRLEDHSFGIFVKKIIEAWSQLQVVTAAKLLHQKMGGKSIRPSSLSTIR